MDAAVAAGVDVRGYLHWSLLDGWEFAEGLTRHFGLVAVDPGTADRPPKASFAAYRDLIAARWPGTDDRADSARLWPRSARICGVGATS